jgi:hypothetical protein
MAVVQSVRNNFTDNYFCITPFSLGRQLPCNDNGNDDCFRRQLKIQIVFFFNYISEAPFLLNGLVGGEVSMVRIPPNQ